LGGERRLGALKEFLGRQAPVDGRLAKDDKGTLPFRVADSRMVVHESLPWPVCPAWGRVRDFRLQPSIPRHTALRVSSEGTRLPTPKRSAILAPRRRGQPMPGAG